MQRNLTVNISVIELRRRYTHNYNVKGHYAKENHYIIIIGGHTLYI